MSINVFTCAGNLGRDAELRYTTQGKPLINFPLPVKAGFGEHEKLTWFKCIMWGERVEKLAQYLTKGQKVVVSGEIHCEEWVNNLGEKKTTPTLTINNLDFAGTKKDDPVMQMNQEQIKKYPTIAEKEAMLAQQQQNMQSTMPAKTVNNIQELQAELMKTPNQFDDDIPF